ncbi:hypothetical protein N7466_007833 [Penicillium verhagenii]|uniref:uncharacterized protein n=1 Tax=Penicillium verhagenii TaxID=1562060 RepID=UPI002545BBC3|nr:uncharacterized protein N7466_007833 [Penicillium verhagenii]KAJ5928877.1 hypothetical protein N7466_007833 [Penicillium verhagenii]
MQSSRTSLTKQAKKLRFWDSVISWLDRYLSWPLPPNPSLELTIPTTVSKTPGSIQLYIFTAPDQAPTSISSQPHGLNAPPRPVLINFHGGGFSIGHAIDDARWAHSVLKAHPDSIFVSVNYRLAPEHPFPIAIEDGVDAILWLWDHAENYNLDRKRFVLCGASAGGNLSFTVPLRLHEELEVRGRLDTKSEIKLAGSVAFYPTVDWTRSRSERDATNPIAAERSMIPPKIFTFFDESYLLKENLPKLDDGKSVDMGHPYLSPGVAPTNLVLEAFPPSVAIYTCGWDQLLVEGNTLRERICRFVDEGRMKHVGGFVVEEAIHGFDKRPTFCLKNEARDRMYSNANEELGIMWSCTCEEDEDSEAENGGSEV